MSINYNFTDKVVLITGSSSGIGAATAVQFAQSGANVVITGRRPDNISEVAKQCQNISPKKLQPLEVIADLANDTDIRQLLSKTIRHFGRLDILVNNAGIGICIDINQSDYYENYLKVLQIDLNSMVLLTHLSIDYLSKTRGNIVNISSFSALRTTVTLSPYCMAKSAMDMFTKCCAAELGPKYHIRVNSINVGIVKTNILIAMGNTMEDSDNFYDAYDSITPVGRVGQPDDIANAVLLLASDQHSEFITGSQFVVDGGSIAANAFLC